MGIWYCTREDVKSALDFNETARNNVQVDRAIEAASRTIESDMNRVFYPTVATRYFDWPNYGQGAYPWRLWLDQNELASSTGLVVVSGSVTISSANVNVEPINDGPPYTYIELNLASTASFSSGSTWQRNIVITGTFGYWTQTTPAGSTAEVLDGTETGVDVTDSSLIGVGDIIAVDDERMTVTAKSMLTSGQTLQTPLTADDSNVTVAVTAGSSFAVGETILLDSERMLIVDIAGNNLTVKRAFDGSVLATHTGSTIYAPRTLTVVRGALGTTAATHLTAAPILKHVVPGGIRSLCIADALNTVLLETAGYPHTRTSGSGDSTRNASGGWGLEDIRSSAYNTYGRKARFRSV